MRGSVLEGEAHCGQMAPPPSLVGTSGPTRRGWKQLSNQGEHKKGNKQPNGEEEVERE